MCFTTGLINVNVILEPTRVLLLALLLEKNAGCKHRVHTAILSYFHALELKKRAANLVTDTCIHCARNLEFYKSITCLPKYRTNLYVNGTTKIKLVLHIVINLDMRGKM